MIKKQNFAAKELETFKISPERAKAYQEYIKSAKARVERILDDLEEKRLKHELSASRRFARHGFHSLARRMGRGR